MSTIYDRGLRFNRSKTGLILGFLLATVLVVAGTFLLIINTRAARKELIVGSLFIVGLGIMGLIIESRRAKKSKT